MTTTIGFIKEAPAISVSGFNVYHKNRLIRVCLESYVAFFTFIHIKDFYRLKALGFTSEAST